MSGADEIEKRPGFMALLNRIESNGVRVVIVEDASRFARKLMTQELDALPLKRGRPRLPNAYCSTTPKARFVRAWHSCEPR